MKMTRKSSGMKRTAFYLSKTQIDKLQKLARKDGLSASEILRRIIDEYWERQGQEKWKTPIF
jgi:hypothetical protein